MIRIWWCPCGETSVGFYDVATLAAAEAGALRLRCASCRLLVRPVLASPEVAEARR